VRGVLNGGGVRRERVLWREGDGGMWGWVLGWALGRGSKSKWRAHTRIYVTHNIVWLLN